MACTRDRFLSSPVSTGFLAKTLSTQIKYSEQYSSTLQTAARDKDSPPHTHKHPLDPRVPDRNQKSRDPPPTTSRPSLAELVHTRVHGQALARHALRRAYAAGAGPASSSQHRKVSTGKRAPGGDVPDVCLGWTCALATCALGAVRFGRCTRLAGPERARGKPRRCD